MAIKLRGRPRKYKTVEELKEKIQYYFDSITRDTKATTIKENEIEGTTEEVAVYNNAGEQVIYTEFIKQPSIVGLCLFIGIERETLNQYEKKEEFSDTIHEAKQIIVEQKLEMLPLMKNPRGLMFDLSANYGMHEKTEIESKNVNHNLNEEVLTPEERKTRIKELLDKKNND